VGDGRHSGVVRAAGGECAFRQGKGLESRDSQIREQKAKGSNVGATLKSWNDGGEGRGDAGTGMRKTETKKLNRLGNKTPRGWGLPRKD